MHRDHLLSHFESVAFLLTETDGLTVAADQRRLGATIGLIKAAGDVSRS